MKEKIIKYWHNLKRMSLDIGMLAGVFALAWFAPSEILPAVAKLNVLSLFFTKLIFVSAGIVHAHISRALVFDYIDFKTEKEWSNNAMIIIWYMIIIFAWARGG